MSSLISCTIDVWTRKQVIMKKRQSRCWPNVTLSKTKKLFPFGLRNWSKWVLMKSYAWNCWKCWQSVWRSAWIRCAWSTALTNWRNFWTAWSHQKMKRSRSWVENWSKSAKARQTSCRRNWTSKLEHSPQPARCWQPHSEFQPVKAKRCKTTNDRYFTSSQLLLKDGKHLIHHRVEVKQNNGIRLGQFEQRLLDLWVGTSVA